MARRPFPKRTARLEDCFRRVRKCLGSARVSRVGDGVSPSRTFIGADVLPGALLLKDCCGETPQPTRETRALPKPSPGLGEIFFIDLEPGEVFHSTALRSDRGIPDAQKRIEHGLDAGNAM
jgi:hypothetical protein